MADTAGFRAVLHEWARRQLEEKSHHVGPFKIIDVRLDYDPGWGGSDVTPGDSAITDVRIRFRHPGGCPAWSRPEWPCQPDNAWSPMDSENTVSMLNQLLAIADESS